VSHDLDPEAEGERLATDLNDTLNKTFEDRGDYRAAVESVISHFESVVDALDEEEERS
jgi:hypothetical protein